MRPLRIYLFGATSMTGWSLSRLATGHELVPFCNPYRKLPSHHEMRRIKLEDESDLQALFHEPAPDLLLHLGGICDVEKCERHPDWAERINVESLTMLLRHLPVSTRLVYGSSDHVFGGKLEGAYDEESPTAPISVYGRSRVAAEQLVREQRPGSLVLRWGLPVGPSVDGRSGHLDWLRYRTERKLPITVVHDEVRSAVWVDDLARRVLALAVSPVSGLRHIVAERAVSRRDLALALCQRYLPGARVAVESRAERRAPHLGRVELATCFDDAWSAPLPSPMALSARAVTDDGAWSA